MTRSRNQNSEKSDRSSYFNDRTEQLWTNLTFNKLPRNFEAIILSGVPEQSNSPNSGETIGSDFSTNNDNRYYFVRVRPLKTSGVIIPDPFAEKDLAKAKKLINMHPQAYIAVSDTVHPTSHGDVFLCRYTRRDRLGIALVKRVRTSSKKFIGAISNRGAHTFHNSNSPILLSDAQNNRPQPNNYDESKDPLRVKYGIIRKKGIYNGDYAPRGTEVLNGYPVWGAQLLGTPSGQYWQFRNDPSDKAKFPAGTLLKDVIPSFDAMAKAYKEHFGYKLIGSTQRTVKDQISVRRKGVNNGSCRDMRSKSGKWINESGETKICKTATPGSSKHGWACAIDIKKPDGGYLTFGSKEYKWLLEWSELPDSGWHNPSWAKRGGSNPEAWHWEPKTWPITLV